MAGLRPFSYGNVLTQGENIKGARLNNVLKQQEINALNSPTGGIEWGKINPRDWKAGSMAKYQKSRDLNDLERYERYKVGTINGAQWLIDVTGENPNIELSSTESEAQAAGAISYGREEGTQKAQLESMPKKIDLELGKAESLGELDLTQQPEIEKRKVIAGAEGRAEVAEKVETKRLGRAYKTYEVGRNNLVRALKDTITGPGFGRLPAVTAAAQVAENAKAIMLPILKAIVRGPGEGVFTDADAFYVLSIMPDRITDEDALDKVIKNVDDYMMTKLRMEPKTSLPDGVTEEDIVETMRIHNMTRQQVLDKYNGG